MKRTLLDRLAALEHEQWAHWTRYMLAHLTPENIERWKRQAETSYEDLSGGERESDRVWARKMLEEMKKAEDLDLVGGAQRASSHDYGPDAWSERDPEERQAYLIEFKDMWRAAIEAIERQ